MIVECVLCFILLRMIDVVFIPPHLPSRWFLLHAIANTFIAIGVFNDVIDLLMCPKLVEKYFQLTSVHTPLPITPHSVFTHIMNPTFALFPVNMVFALHLYHVLYFNLSKSDVFHHSVFIPTMFITTFVVAVSYPYLITVVNFIIFFICGFPGGVTYWMLVLVKHQHIEKITEKQVSKFLNSYIRMPGLLLGCCWIYTYNTYCEGWDEKGVLLSLLSNFTMALLSYNAIYYNNLSVETVVLSKIKKEK